MRKEAFIVAMLGLSILFILIVLPGKEIFNLEELEEMDLKEKIVLRGFVDGERVFENFRILSVDGVEVICDCLSFLEKEVEVVGFVEEFNGKKQVRALRISILN